MNHRNTEESFWRNVAKLSVDECWEWRAARLKAGYGRFRWQQRQRCAHQIAWEITNGPVPNGQCVLHKCDNPPCVNPAHLFLGTKKDNAEDRDSKGRAAYGNRNGSRTRPDKLLRGEQNPRAVLTESRVLEARRRHEGGVTYTRLATEYGVTIPVLRNAVIGKTWKHIGEIKLA